MAIGKESFLPTNDGERHLKVEDVQEAYVEQKDRYGAFLLLNSNSIHFTSGFIGSSLL